MIENAYYHGTSLTKALSIKDNGWKPVIVMPNGVKSTITGNFFSKTADTALGYTRSAETPAIIVVIFKTTKLLEINSTDELWHKSNADFAGYDGLIIPSTIRGSEREYLIFDANTSTGLLMILEAERS